MSDASPLSNRNLENRRRRREVTLLRKVYELHMDNNAEVYLLIQHRENDRVLIFNSEPAENWPLPYEKLKNWYPRPQINTPTKPASLLRRALTLPPDHEDEEKAGADTHGATTAVHNAFSMDPFAPIQSAFALPMPGLVTPTSSTRTASFSGCKSSLSVAQSVVPSPASSPTSPPTVPNLHCTPAAIAGAGPSGPSGPSPFMVFDSHGPDSNGQSGLASQLGSPIRFTNSTLEVVSDSDQDERIPSPDHEHHEPMDFEIPIPARRITVARDPKDPNPHTPPPRSPHTPHPPPVRNTQVRRRPYQQRRLPKSAEKTDLPAGSWFMSPTGRRVQKRNHKGKFVCA